MLWNVVLNPTKRISDLIFSHRVVWDTIERVMTTWGYRKIDPVETEFFGNRDSIPDDLGQQLIYERNGTVYIVQDVHFNLTKPEPPSFEIREIGFLK